MQGGRGFRSRFDGLGAHVGAATVLVVLAALSLLLFLQSPRDRLLWTGQKVVGTERQGLVWYTWDGQSYSLDVPGYRTIPQVTVYLDRSNPSDAVTNSLLTRAMDGLFLVVPLVLAGVIVMFGVRRVRRERAYIDQPDRKFGIGLDPEFVQRHLEENRRQP